MVGPHIVCVIPTKTVIVAAEKGPDTWIAMNEEKCGHYSSQRQKNYATIAGTGVDIIDATARSFPG